MKKIRAFLRSMTFGMLLLLAVIAFSFAGSMIPQQRPVMEYVSRYGATAGEWIVRLGLDDVFATPVFIALMAALALNLTLCSVVRVRSLRGSGVRLVERARTARVTDAPGRAQQLGDFLRRRGFRAQDGEGVTVYSKWLFGAYGSFLTHLGLLAVLLAGVLALYGGQITDETVMPGQTLTLPDGTSIEVLSFRIEDETGRLDYASELRMTDAQGQSSAQALVRVNEPMRFGRYKVYQQTYGTAGAIRLRNEATGGEDTVYLTEPAFLTVDGQTGVFFAALYPGYIEEEDGSVTLITSTSGAYADPVYDLRVMAQGQTTPVLAFPGEELSLGGITYIPAEPVSYPGLRIKAIPSGVLGVLYASFVLLIAALTVCFFMRPVCVAVRPEGYAIVSQRPQLGLQLELEALTREEERT